MPDDATIQRSDAARVNQSELVEIRLVKFYFIAALGFLCMALLGGMLVDLQLVGWNPLGRLELFSPGRWQMMQTDALAYGFLTNALFGCLHWMVPRNTLRPFASRELSYFVFILWQAIMLATFVGILAGEAQGVGWGETPVFVDPWALIALLLMSLNFVRADPQRQRSTARAALVFPGGSRVDAADLRDGKLRARSILSRARRRASCRRYSCKICSDCASRHSVGERFIFFAADHRHADLEPPIIANRFLGTGIFLPLERSSKFLAQSDSLQPADRRRCGHGGV